MESQLFGGDIKAVTRVVSSIKDIAARRHLSKVLKLNLFSLNFWEK
tara:strand:+ start:442 stop:579 length:138 start_codon:yes stop_codon:yes gene_type:complete